MKQIAFLCIVAVASTVASTGWCADDKAPAKDAKDSAVNGRWKLISGENAGEKMSDEVVKSIHLILANGKYLAKVGDETDEGEYTLDTTKTPHTLTLTGKTGPNKGKTMLAIYEVDQKTLKVCYDVSGKAFPTKFESAPKSTQFLATYERQRRGKPRMTIR